MPRNIWKPRWRSRLTMAALALVATAAAGLPTAGAVAKPVPPRRP